MNSPIDTDALRARLAAVPKPERLDYLADLPPDELALFKRIMPTEDIRRLNQHIDLRNRRAARPTRETWLAEARAGRATTVDAMIEVLREQADRLRPQDAQWIDRIEQTASASGYSRRQTEVIRGIYGRYFSPKRGTT